VSGVLVTSEPGKEDADHLIADELPLGHLLIFDAAPGGAWAVTAAA
jgi:hypothetical protein